MIIRLLKNGEKHIVQKNATPSTGLERTDPLYNLNCSDSICLYQLKHYLDELVNVC